LSGCTGHMGGTASDNGVVSKVLLCYSRSALGASGVPRLPPARRRRTARVGCRRSRPSRRRRDHRRSAWSGSITASRTRARVCARSSASCRAVTMRTVQPIAPYVVARRASRSASPRARKNPTHGRCHAPQSPPAAPVKRSLRRPLAPLSLRGCSRGPPAVLARPVHPSSSARVPLGGHSGYGRGHRR
jgi:hypothetical protein